MPTTVTLWDYYRLYRKAFGAYTPQVILITILAVVSSVFEGLGITAIIPIFSFVGGNVAGLPTDTISKFIGEAYQFIGVAYTFRNLLIGVLFLFVSRTLVLFGIQYVTGRIVFGYERDMRRSLFSSLLSAQWPYLSRQKIGHLEQLLTTNVSNASQLFGILSTAVIIMSKTLMYIVISINVSWWVAAVSLIVGGVLFLLLRPLFSKNRILAMEAESNNRDLAHFSAEHMIGMKALKSMSVEESVKRRGDFYFERVRLLNMGMILVRSLIALAVQFSGVAFIALVFAIMYRSPGFSVAAFAVIVYAIGQIFGQVQSGQVQMHGMGTLAPYLSKLLASRDEARQYVESSGGSSPFAIGKGIAFDKVSFTYQGRDAALSSVSFTIPYGALVGLIGPSGAGKTTVADLLLRMVDPAEGSIRADNVDVRDISVRDWRRHIGYVPQDAILLDDTIEANIVFYDKGISHDDVVVAAKSANIHSFIETLPDQYATIVGDRGTFISGGQRQRVALARALARKPDLLVLDEATSSLDAESENAIKVAVEGLRGSTSVLIIAHRMSSVAGVDRIVVLKKGEVIEEGEPGELLQRSDSYYARMSRSGDLNTIESISGGGIAS